MEDDPIEEEVEPMSVPAPVVAVAAPAVRRSQRPEPQDIKVTAAQYARIRQYRWERSRGFLAEMRANHPGEKTRPEWDQLWEVFWKRTV
jgi:hypothetical protein